MNSFARELNDLFNSLENKKLLTMLKENFIFTLNENIEFNEEYSEDLKKIYFENYKNYIALLSECMDKQKKISDLELSELYKVNEYHSNKNILYTLEWSVEYLRNKYSEIDLNKDVIIKNNLESSVEVDLEKICGFLNEHIGI